jgi:hypothetical protein
MRQATFGTDIHGRAAVDPATGYPWPRESAVVISTENAQRALLVVAPTAQIIDNVIIARMSVANPTDEVVSIVVNPFGGTFPYGGDSPFTLGFSRSGPVTYAGELFPPAPPVPIHIDFPPQTEVTFEATIQLARWSWSGNPTVPLEWAFHFAAGPTPSGTLSVQLTVPRHGQ